MKLRGRLACLLSALALVACGGGDNNGNGNNTNNSGNSNGSTSEVPSSPVAGASTGSVTGKAVASDSGQPLGNVQVFNAEKIVTTAEDGSFKIEGVAAAQRTVLRFAKNGYADAFATIATDAAGANNVVARLSPVTASATFESAAGATLTDTRSAASVSLPAASLVVDGTGAAPQGPVTASIAVIDPAANPANMPGDYRTSAGSTIESYGALSVQLRDSAGNRLNLASGQASTIRIPLSTRSEAALPTIALYYFNETTGLWVEEGSATLAGTAPNQYYEGTVRHFTVWNADIVMETVFVNGCLVDPEGLPLNLHYVRSEGVDYSGLAYAITDAQGKFRVAVRRNGTAKIEAAGLRTSSAVLINPTAADITSPACLTLQPSTLPALPALLSQPRLLTAQVGSAAIFGVVAAGPELKYEWMRNGQPIAGATRPIYTLYPISDADNGAQFSVRVFNAAGSVTSNPAQLTVLPGLPPQVDRLLRLTYLGLELNEMGFAPFGYFTNADNNTWLNPASVCLSGSASGTLNGQAIPFNSAIAAGRNTVTGIFNNCIGNDEYYSNVALTGTATVVFDVNAGLLNGSASTQMVNMRRVFNDSATINLSSDLTGNGSATVSNTTTVADGKKTTVTVVRPGLDSSLHSNKTGQTAVFKSGSIRSVSIDTIAGESIQSLLEENNVTYVFDGDTYVVSGTISLALGRGSVGGSGQVVVTRNGERVGRMYATPQGYFFETNGTVPLFDQAGSPIARNLRMKGMR